MKVLSAVLLVCSIRATPAAAAVAVDLSGVTDVRVTRDGGAIAAINEAAAGPVVNVFRADATPKLLLTIGLRQLAGFSTDAHIGSIAWSADGRLLAIGVNDGDESSALFVVEPARGLSSCRLLKVGAHDVAWGSWSTTGHLLYVTLADAHGLHELDPVTMKVRRLVANVEVATPIAVSTTTIVTKIEHLDTPGIGAELVSVDIRTGKLTRLARTTW